MIKSLLNCVFSAVISDITPAWLGHSGLTCRRNITWRRLVTKVWTWSRVPWTTWTPAVTSTSSWTCTTRSSVPPCASSICLIWGMRWDPGLWMNCYGSLITIIIVIIIALYVWEMSYICEYKCYYMCYSIILFQNSINSHLYITISHTRSNICRTVYNTIVLGHEWFIWMSKLGFMNKMWHHKVWN